MVLISEIYCFSYNDIRKDKTFTTDEDLGFPDNKFPLPLADKFVEENYPAQRANPDFFAYWCYIVSFPILLVVLVLHLILHNLYIFGVVVRQLIILLVHHNSRILPTGPLPPGCVPC